MTGNYNVSQSSYFYNSTSWDSQNITYTSGTGNSTTYQLEFNGVSYSHTFDNSLSISYSVPNSNAVTSSAISQVRPDDDGYLTLSEANEWYSNGNGQTMTVDLK